MRRLLMIAFLFLSFNSAFAGAESGHSGHHERTEPPSPEKTSHRSHRSRGMYGPYPMTREASGTAWLPDSSPHEGWHRGWGPWSVMLHGFINGIYDDQGGRRGDTKTFSQSMFMVMAQRPAGPGTLGLRSMLSLDPLMGKAGYPLLLQTGETADGRTPLIDRQHPHDFLMELAASYSLPLGERVSMFLYGGLPGEPALGPATFMHRFSGIENPEAPISHHWLDSTHITFGVLTLGYVHDRMKMEVSGFKGREPDEHRWNFEEPDIDSYSLRFTVNPAEDWSAQVSYGDLNSPEQLEPDEDLERITASVAHNTRLAKSDNIQTTLAWGRNIEDTSEAEDSFLLESALRLRGRSTLFGRFENVDNDELFGSADHHAGQLFNVSKLTLGFVYDVANWHGILLGAGATGSAHFLPSSLEHVYGETPLSSMLFVRAKLGNAERH